MEIKKYFGKEQKNMEIENTKEATKGRTNIGII